MEQQNFTGIIEICQYHTTDRTVTGNLRTSISGHALDFSAPDRWQYEPTLWGPISDITVGPRFEHEAFANAWITAEVGRQGGGNWWNGMIFTIDTQDDGSESHN